jgi:hypothetical protein
MGSKGDRPREGSNVVRTGAELARLTEAGRDLAEQLVPWARSEGLNLVGENGLLKGLVKPSQAWMMSYLSLIQTSTQHLHRVGGEFGDRLGGLRQEPGRPRRTGHRPARSPGHLPKATPPPPCASMSALTGSPPLAWRWPGP